jgi:hypothetical protein
MANGYGLRSARGKKFQNQLQTPYNIQFLETHQIWGSITKIKDPIDFFNSIDPRIWHPVFGVSDDKHIEYFEDLEIFFEILDQHNVLVGFIRVLFEESTISLHGSIIRNQIVAYKAWHQLLSSAFFHVEQLNIKSRVLIDNNKALSFLLNSGFQVAFIQNIGELKVVHLDVQYANFMQSKIAYLHNNKLLPSIKIKPLLVKTIQEFIELSTQWKDKLSINFYCENAKVIYDENLWMLCLFETHTKFHEITVFFIDEFENTHYYAPLKENYCFAIFTELSKTLENLIDYPFLLKVSRTEYNLAPLFFQFKYLGADNHFLFFNSNS